MSGQIQKKRPFGGGPDKSDSEFSDMMDQLPSMKGAEDAIRDARRSAQLELERKITAKRKKEAEEVCACWS